MDSKHQTFLRIFEKLGTPLIAAVNEVKTRTGQSDSDENEDAQKLAQLLTIVTRESVVLAEKADIVQSDSEKDDLRLSLTTIIAPLIASLYQMGGKIPEEKETGQLADSFAALSSYIDNFISIKEGSSRIGQMEDGQYFIDENQIRIQTLSTLIPIVNSVIAFPFGEKPSKLIRNICSRLIEESATLQEKLFPTSNNSEAKHAQLSLLRPLVVVYSQCHFSEMARILNSQDKNRAGASLSIEPVWKAFGERVEMIDAVSSVLSGNEAVSRPVEEVVEPEESVATEEQPAEPEPIGQHVPTNLAPGDTLMAETHDAPLPKEKPKDPSNPMAFFAQGDADKSDESKQTEAGT